MKCQIKGLNKPFIAVLIVVSSSDASIPSEEHFHICNFQLRKFL